MSSDLSKLRIDKSQKTADGPPAWAVRATLIGIC